MALRSMNHHVQVIILRPTQLSGFMVLPTEVFCDSGLVSFIECSNEPYITSSPDLSLIMALIMIMILITMITLILLHRVRRSTSVTATDL